MIKINLIPARQRIRSSPINRIVIAIAMAIVVGCIFLYLNQVIDDLNKRNQLANTEVVFGILNQSKDKISLLNKYNQFKDAKGAQLIKFTEQRVPWYALLSELSLVLPQQVRVVSVNGGGMVVSASDAAKAEAAKTPAKPGDKTPATPAPAANAAVPADFTTHIILNCESDSYAVIAQFIDILNKSKRFTKPVVSGLTRGNKSAATGEVNLDTIQFSVDITASFK